jgi:energy-coupling factor transport system ATP-binding protein
MQGRGHEVFSRAEELAAVGLNIPEISRMCLALRERGIPMDDGIFTVEAAEECLLRLLNEQGREERS